MNGQSLILYLCSMAGERRSQRELCKTPKERVRAQESQHVLAHALLHYALYMEAERKRAYIRPLEDTALTCFILTEERLCRLISEVPNGACSEEALLYTRMGKPYLKPPGSGTHAGSQNSRITFNLSHTDGAVICALGSSAIGADIEYCADASMRMSEHLLRRSLTENERNYVYEARTEQERNLRFLRLWTLKESFAKACARGLSLPFRSISFPLWEEQTENWETSRQSRSFAEKNMPFLHVRLEELWKDKRGDQPNGWTFWQGMYGGYIITVCMRKHQKFEDIAAAADF